MRIVVPDDFTHTFAGSPYLERLSRVGELELFDTPVPDEAESVRRLRDAHIVIGNRKRTPLSRQVLERLPELKLLSMTGTSFTNIDVEAATELGIVVTHTPHQSSRTVAEHAVGLLVALLKRIPEADAAIRAGKWEACTSTELHGKTLGLVGLGRIGSEVAGMAAGLGLKVVAWDPALSPTDMLTMGIFHMPLDDLLRTADAVSIHARLSQDTRGMIGALEIGLMKPTAVLVNTARGALIDERHLVAALQERRLAGAALDVFAKEPLPADSPLLSMSNVIMTPHMAWTTREVLERFVAGAVGNVESYLAGIPTNLLNPEVWANRRPV